MVSRISRSGAGALGTAAVGTTYLVFDEVQGAIDRLETAAPTAAASVEAREDRLGEVARDIHLETRVVSFVDALGDRITGGDDVLRTTAGTAPTYLVSAILTVFLMTYGPRMAFNDGRVVSNFVVNALRGEPLQLYGGGSQSRSFCFQANLIKGLMSLMDYEGSLKHQPFNLGNPHEITIRELADAVLRLTDSGSELKDGPLPQDDPTRRCPDISRASAEFGFDPQIELDAGLHATINDFKQRMA